MEILRLVVECIGWFLMFYLLMRLIGVFAYAIRRFVIGFNKGKHDKQ